MSNKIEDLRKILNKELENKNVSKEEILILSQKLDEYIVEYCNLKIEQEKNQFDSNIKDKGENL